MRACKPDAPRQTVTLWIAAGEVHGGVQSVTKTVEGRRDALWEDLHTVLCTMALPLARWADSVCVTTMLRTPPLLSLSMHQLNGFTMSKGVNWKKCLFFFSNDCWSDQRSMYRRSTEGLFWQRAEDAEVSGHVMSSAELVLVSKRKCLLFKLRCFSDFESVLI